MKGKNKKDESSVVSACADALTQNPLPVLVLTCFAVSLMCIGYSEYDVIKDVAKLWIQEGSVVGDEIDYSEDHTYDVDKTTTQLVTTVRYPNTGDDVMNEYSLNKHLEAAVRISEVEVTYDGNTYGYNDVCDSTVDYLLQCVRVTALDCFKEGGYDFPAMNGMLALESVVDEATNSYIGNARNSMIAGVEENFYDAYRASASSYSAPAFVNATDVSSLNVTLPFCRASENHITVAVQIMSYYTLQSAPLSYDAATSAAFVQSFGDRNSADWNEGMLVFFLRNEGYSQTTADYLISSSFETGSDNWTNWTSDWSEIIRDVSIEGFVDGVEGIALANLDSSTDVSACGSPTEDRTSLESPYRQCLVRLMLTGQSVDITSLGLSFDSSNYDNEISYYRLVCSKNVVNTEGTGKFTVSSRNIGLADIASGPGWVRWWIDNECPNFVAEDTECGITSALTVKNCEHYNQVTGSNIHSITEAECVSNLITFLQNDDPALTTTIYGAVIGNFGLDPTTATAEDYGPIALAYFASGVVEQLTASGAISTCESMYGETDANSTNYTRSMVFCAIKSGGVTPHSEAYYDDTVYYTYASIAFLDNYGLSPVSTTDWTQNFPIELILHLYLTIAEETPISSRENTTYECDEYDFTFTNVSDFYTQFIAAGCPTIGIDLNGDTYCLRNSNCEICEDNEYGVTPYSGRPSFRGMTDAEIAAQLSTTCYYWDEGLAYPSIPQELVLGRPEPTNAVESNTIYTHVNGYELLLNNNDAERFRVKVKTRWSDPVEITVDEAEIILEMWMDAFMEAAPEKTDSDSTSSDGYGIMTNSYSSKTFNDILDEASDSAYPLLISGLLLVYFYAFVTTGFSLLAIGGVSLVLLGTIGGIGLSLGFGVSLNATTVNVLPFLMLGLGVDDMFIFHRTLMQIRERSDVKQMSPADQVATVLREAGPCVCLTTFTNFCAFMIGSLTPLPVVRQFAFTASITVVVSWFTNLVGFNALCVLSLKYTPDLSISGALCGTSDGVSFATWSKRIVETKVSPFLTNTTVRIVTLIFFGGLWGLSGYGISQIEMGLSIKEICKKGTQERDFLSVRDDYFAFYSTSIAAYADVEWHDPTVQEEYLRVEQAVYDVSYNLERVESWLRKFLEWCDPTTCTEGATVDRCGSYFQCTVNSEGLFDAGADAFFVCLNQWYTFTTVTSSPTFYPITDELIQGRDVVTYPIEYVKFPLYSQKMWTTDDFVAMIDQTRAIIDESSLDLFPLGTSFTFWEQYRELEKLLLQNLGVAVSCTFAIGTLSIFVATNSMQAPVLTKLLKSAHGSLIMCFSMISTMISLLGFMGLANIWLSAIPALTVIAAMGICVDLTALLTLFFCSSSGSHNDRIKAALVAVFVPTLDSMLSTIFGCVALAFSDISLYVKFFFWMYFAVAVIGCLNGLLLLPVLLAWAGPSEFGGTAKVSDVSSEPKHLFSDPKGTTDTKTDNSL